MARRASLLALAALILACGDDPPITGAPTDDGPVDARPECESWGLAFDVRIETEADIQALAGQKIIEGNVRVGDEGMLRSLAGLDALEEITGSLVVESVSLRSLEGLESLHHVGGRLSIDAPRVADTEPLSALETVGCRVEVFSSNVIRTVRLPNLKSASRFAAGGRYLDEVSVPRVTDLIGLTVVSNATIAMDFASLESVTMDLRLEGASGAGFPSLETVGERVDIVTGSVTVVSFPSLRSIGGRMDLEGAPDTLDLPVLEHAHAIYAAVVEEIRLPSLATSDGLHLDARVVDISALVSAGWLESSGDELRAGSLVESDRVSIGARTLELGSLESVPNRLTLSSTRGVVSIPLREVGVLYASGPMQLRLGQLARAGTIELRNAAMIEDLGPVTVIEDEVYISGSETTDLASFANVERIGRSLSIHSSPNLTAIGFDNLTSVGETVPPRDALISVVDNGALPQCVVEEFLNRMTANGYLGRVGDGENGPACD